MAAPSSSSTYQDPQQICDYVLLRHVNVSKDADSEKIYKKWTRLWVVAHCQVSPLDSFVSYCKKENQWLKNDASVSHYTLNDFSISMISTRKHDNVIRVEFPAFTLELSFDSQTKMDLYFQLLSKASMRYHVDLVRAPKHPDKEGEYIIEDCSDSYRVWLVLENGRGKLAWEWNLRTIRRIHYHKTVEKLEIEAGRLAETGEGHFFFTGRHAFSLFEAMKTELMARAQQKAQAQQKKEAAQNKSLPTSLESLNKRTNLSRTPSSASAGAAQTKQKQHPLSVASPSNGLSVARQKAGGRLSHSNGALPAKSSVSLDESETSSEDYSASDNSSFTGTGGSLHDWTATTPSPTSFAGGLFERAPQLPPRIADGRPFSPCSTTSSSSSSMSGYNVPPRRAYPHPVPPSSGRYMQVKREEMDGDSDYMTMNPALRKKTPPTTEEPVQNDDGEEEEEEEEEEDDEEYSEEYIDGYTDMKSPQGDKKSDVADQYMRMVPIGGATLTRELAQQTSSLPSSPLPPSPPPPMASRFAELKIVESSTTPNTFPRDSTKS